MLTPKHTIWDEYPKCILKLRKILSPNIIFIHLNFHRLEESSQPIKININDFKVKNVVGQILTSDKVQDHNTFENPTIVKLRNYSDFKIQNGNLEITMPPISVIVLELKG